MLMVHSTLPLTHNIPDRPPVTPSTSRTLHSTSTPLPRRVSRINKLLICTVGTWRYKLPFLWVSSPPRCCCCFKDLPPSRVELAGLCDTLRVEAQRGRTRRGTGGPAHTMWGSESGQAENQKKE